MYICLNELSRITGILEKEARLLTQAARAVFITLGNHHMAVSNWSNMENQATQYFYQELYCRFPYLLLCKNHRKIEKFASSIYTGWFWKEKGDGRRVIKQEPIDTTEFVYTIVHTLFTIIMINSHSV